MEKQAKKIQGLYKNLEGVRIGGGSNSDEVGPQILIQQDQKLPHMDGCLQPESRNDHINQSQMMV